MTISRHDWRASADREIWTARDSPRRAYSLLSRASRWRQWTHGQRVPR
jgi:hypothetical protein